MKGIQKKPTAGTPKASVYVDVELFTESQANDSPLPAYNTSKQMAGAYWKNTGNTGLNQRVTGMGRITTYIRLRDGTKSSILEITEGMLEKGRCKGYCRIIKARKNQCFVGMLDKNIADGKGIYYEKGKKKHQGVYWNEAGNKGTLYKSAPPTN